MPDEHIKIVLDANIWVSFAIGKRMIELERVLQDNNIRVFVCSQLFVEVDETLSKPKLRKYVSAERQKVLLNYMASCVTATAEAHATRSRDPKDNFLLDLAEAVAADFLVTGDGDLLVLKRHFDTAIISFTDLLRTLEFL
jgi:putative PIN family toxin of toxin-antitoxin system